MFSTKLKLYLMTALNNASSTIYFKYRVNTVFINEKKAVSILLYIHFVDEIQTNI